MINRKLHIRFRLAPTAMTLDDLELFEVRIYGEFCRLASINEWVPVFTINHRVYFSRLCSLRWFAVDFWRASYTHWGRTLRYR